MGLKNDNILYEKKGHCGLITLNRADKLNAITSPLLQELQEVLYYISSDDEVKVVIITGAGRAFSAGIDMDTLSNLGSPEDFRELMRSVWHKVFNMIEGMEKVFIAAMNGMALGAGLELALACDLRVAADGVKLALPEINFGIIPDLGGTIRLTRLIGHGRAKEIILSGEPIVSEEARAIGLVNSVLPVEGFMEAAFRYAEKFAGKSSVALGLAKLAVNRNPDQDVHSGLEDALMVQSVLLKTPEFTASLEAFKEKLKKKS